jgi:hypothetical protein
MDIATKEIAIKGISKIAAYVKKPAILDCDRLCPWLLIVNCKKFTASKVPVCNLLTLQFSAVTTGNNRDGDQGCAG